MHDTDVPIPPATAIPESNHKVLYEDAMMRLTTVSRIAETIALGKNTRETWQRSLQDIVLLMHASVGSIYMLNDDRTRLSCVFEYSSIAGTSVSIEDGIELELLEGLPIMEILRNGSSVRLDTISDELNERLNLHTKRRPYFYNSAICSPILIGTSINGAIAVSSKQPNCFTDDDMKVLESIGYIIGTAFHNDQLLRMLRRSKESLAKALTAANSARSLERRRLSMELHDDLGQRLTSLSLKLKALQMENDLDIISDRINGLRFITSDALEELRRILNSLKPAALEGNHILDSIQRLVSDMSAEGGIPIDLDIPPADGFAVTQEKELIIFRCVQEGVTNIVKHSHATMARVSLSQNSDNILLEIRDNGIGLRAGAPLRGMGFEGMKARVAEVSGNFVVDSPGSGGTTISIMLPV